MSGKSLLQKLTAFAVLCGLSSSCPARDVTEVEKSEAWHAARTLVGRDERILKLTTHWGEIDGTPVLAAVLTTRPFEVGEGLCVAEGYQLHRTEGESDFRVLNRDAPVSQYWQWAGSCDAIDPTLITDFGRIRNAIWVRHGIATTHIAQIIRGADDILLLATPDVRCNEPVMPTLFQPGVRLHLIGIDVGQRNRPGVGIQYSAKYSREDDDSGIVVQFTMFQERFEVTSACFWIA